MATIEAEFELFQMQQKRVFGHALELLEAGFGKALDGFDAVGVQSPMDKPVLAVADAEVAVKAHIH